jgi:hypothetical protein
MPEVLTVEISPLHSFEGSRQPFSVLGLPVRQRVARFARVTRYWRAVRVFKAIPIELHSRLGIRFRPARFGCLNVWVSFACRFVKDVGLPMNAAQTLRGTL